MISRMALASILCSRGLSTSAIHQAIKNVAIIGGGLMGAGIAQVAAQTGHNVVMVDVSNEILQKSTNQIKISIERVAKKKFAEDKEARDKFISTSLDRLSYNTDAKKAAQDADIVIEAIIENLEIKQKLFSELDKTAPPHTLFASNTSSLLIREIAQLTERKDRFGGLHFFNPVPVMKLLEVICMEETSDDSYNKMMEFGKALGKHCVTCKDTPGFIVNRLLGPYLRDALQMLERGDATAKDIDVAMKLGAGYPMGPFELMDYVGLDTRKNVIEAWRKRFPDNPLYANSPLVDKLVKEGKFGRKTGEGFYKYN